MALGEVPFSLSGSLADECSDPDVWAKISRHVGSAVPWLPTLSVAGPLLVVRIPFTGPLLVCPAAAQRPIAIIPVIGSALDRSVYYAAKVQVSLPERQFVLLSILVVSA